MEKWFLALNFCREKGIPLEWITNPKSFQNHIQTNARKIVIRELSTKYKPSEIQIVCPVSARWIRLILSEKRGAESRERLDTECPLPALVENN